MNPAESAPDPLVVEPLIQACAACGALMDISDEDPLARIACPVCGAAELVSGKIGAFELEAVVGSGGMGVVYKAYDAGLDRYIALKLLRRDKVVNQQVVEQLATEASITASINHPHVVRVFTTGVDHGRFYIGMELVDKGTLDELIKLQGRVAEAQVIEVGIQIAQGLRAAQQAGLIHRDVKPGNILFADAHTAKIVDFGLAIFMEDEEKARGEIWGTPYYVAPEKLDHQPEDFRSDMYSLGGTLFHALAGRPPFEAPDASMVALKHLKSQAVSLQAFAPHVSGETAYVINRTLSKDPNDRYQSYDELIEHLEYAAKQIEEKASKPPVQRRVVLEDSRQQKLMGWITLGIFALIVAAGITGFIFRKNLFPSRNRSAAQPTPKVQPVPGSIVSTGFPDARAKLVSGDTTGALDLYRQYAWKAKAGSLQAASARYAEGLAQLVVGNLSEARGAFQQVVNGAPYAEGKPDEAAGSFLVDSARRLAATTPVHRSAAGDVDPTNHQAIALLAYGLQNWHMGKVEEGVELLRDFRKVTPTGDSGWITEIKVLATRVLDDHTTFQMAEERIKAPGATPEAKQKALAAIRAMKPPLSKHADALGALASSPATSVAPVAMAASAPAPQPPQPTSTGAAPAASTLPLGEWSQTPIGAPVPWGAATGTAAAFTIESGTGNFEGMSDQGHFVYQVMEGDGDLVVRVASLNARDEWAKMGVMLRSSLEPGARYVFGVIARKGLWQQDRAADNGEIKGGATRGRIAADHTPKWLKLERRGENVATFQSEDGQTWNALGQATIPELPRTVFVGMAANGGRYSLKGSVDNLRITQVAPGKSISLPASATTPLGEWSQVPISAPKPYGKATGTASGMDFEVGRGDFWYKEDAGHFVYQRLEGNCDVIVQVVSMQGNNWSKVGPMLRTSLDPGSRGVCALVSPGRQMVQQVRDRDHDDWRNAPLLSSGGETPPKWVKLERRGDDISTFHSDDGQTWAPFAKTTLVGLPRSVFVGVGGCGRTAPLVARLEGLRLERKP